MMKGCPMKKERMIENVLIAGIALIFAVVCILGVWMSLPKPPPITPTPTFTSVPPTATFTHVPPTLTPTFTPTKTKLPPTRTPKPTITRRPTLTNTPIPTHNFDYHWWNCNSQTWVDYPRYSWHACSAKPEPRYPNK